MSNKIRSKKLIIFSVLLIAGGFGIFLAQKPEADKNLVASLSEIGDNLTNLFFENNPSPAEPIEFISEPAAKLSEATIVFEPSGTHIDSEGNLKIRVDIYPAPGMKTYSQHLVDGQLTPMLSHFITINEDTTKEELENYLKEIFDADSVATLDNALVQENSMHLVSPYMASKLKLQTNPVLPTADKEFLIDEINARFTKINLKGSQKGSVQILTPGSIDVGPGATNRAANLYLDTYTIVSKTNSANANGILDTVEIWLVSKEATNNSFIGTFSAAGDVLTCRDSESIGNVTTGSKQTYTGVSISVNTNDYLGANDKNTLANPLIERATSGGGGIWYYSGEKIDPTDTATFSVLNGQEISIYATGVESGGGEVTTGSSGAVFKSGGTIFRSGVIFR
jgi:hypothetical protein